MKKVLFAVLAACPLLFAESYQVNTLSAKQLGMGHTGAGQKLGSESMHYNPGGLGFLDKTLDISAGITFIMPEVEYSNDNGDKALNDELGKPLYVYLGSSITDWLSAGLSFTTPYGNTLSFGKDWVGANLLQDISLAVYALQPTVAFKFLDKISIGGGPVIYFGTFEQSKALVLAPNLPPTAMSVNFSGDADVAVAANVGILYDLLPNKLALGIAYRSEADMQVAKGKPKVSYANETIENTVAAVPQLKGAVDLLEASRLKAKLPLPANLNAGLSLHPIDNLLLAFDWQMVFWGTYKKLVMDLGNPLFNAESKKDYNNTFAYRFGAQYTLIDQLDLRLGVYFDETPVEDDYLTPESPSTDKLGTTIGFSFRPIPNLSIDASFLYALGFGRDATSGTNPDKPDGLDGRYEVQAWAPSVGVSFNF